MNATQTTIVAMNDRETAIETARVAWVADTANWREGGMVAFPREGECGSDAVESIPAGVTFNAGSGKWGTAADHKSERATWLAGSFFA